MAHAHLADDQCYPEQLADMQALKEALQQFDTDMRALMLQMTSLSAALQRVSRSYDALTSLHFSGAEVRGRAARLTSALAQLREGVAFRRYNARVHRDVVQPAATLRTALHAAQAAASWRDTSAAAYDKARCVVDRKERRYARAHRPLTTSRRYEAARARRDAAQQTLATHKAAFATAFAALLSQTDVVAAQTMRRYVRINAHYLAAVVHALTQADAEAVLHDSDGDSSDQCGDANADDGRTKSGKEDNNSSSRAHTTTAAAAATTSSPLLS